MTSAWLIVVAAQVACGAAAAPVAPHVPPPPAPPVAHVPPPARPVAPTLSGTASYDDGTPAAGALIGATNQKTRVRDVLLVADAAGHFEAVLPPGTYTLAVAAERAFAWAEHQTVPSTRAAITLTRTCHRVAGQALPSHAGTRVELERLSEPSEYKFVAIPHQDGTFAMCLPEGEYSAILTGSTRSFETPVSVPTTASLRISGFATAEVERAPRVQRKVSADLAGLVADIVRRDPQVIGLGEATHGTAEFVPTRGDLTFELIRRAGVRAVLFELDAIAAVRLDDYINGGDIDLAEALPALGFWITDTFEFRHFLEQLRQHNAATVDRVHLWGVDVQNTARPVKLLLDHAAALGLTADEQTALERVSHDRGKTVNELAPTQRAALTRVLSRLGAPRSASLDDLRIALAARSLTIQLGYWDGDMYGHYGERRDAGMATLTHFLVAEAGIKRACLWAHDGHTARQPESAQPNLGQHLAASTDRYYSVGFFVFQGSTRAWDAAGEIGVISHPIPPAAAYTLEGAVMAATGAPDVAWIPVKQLAIALGSWLDTPRFGRYLGHTYFDEKYMMRLLHIPSAFDALVVIKTGHDSSPTPTGVRRAAN